MKWDDHNAISSLLLKYPEYADAGDFAAVGELFAHCDFISGGLPSWKAAGAKAFEEYYASFVRLHPDTKTPKTRHMMSNISIEADGAPDRARSRSYVAVLQCTDRLPLQIIIAGTYHDRFAKIGGVWRFVERHEQMDLVGDLSAHLLRELH